MSTGTVTYTYSSTNQTLVRTDTTVTPNTTATQLSNLSSLTFRYYSNSGSLASTTINIKQIELSYTSAVGSSANGTQSSTSVISARVTLRNKTTSGP
jgi:hypothetical protein